MILFPAIDIRGGSAVRLLRGDYKAETAYDPDPVDAARRWEKGGAEFLHVVDLDGAREGRPVNLDSIKRIVEAVSIPIQVGGGIRDSGAVAALFKIGVKRLVIGTAALRQPTFLGECLEAHADAIVVGVDARAGRVSVSGWQETSNLTVERAIERLTRQGARRFLFTPIEVDGTLEGPNLPALREVAGVAAANGATVIASGGVGSLDHLRRLRREAPAAVEGVIVGRALYDRKFSLPDAIAALRPD